MYYNYYRFKFYINGNKYVFSLIFFFFNSSSRKEEEAGHHRTPSDSAGSHQNQVSADPGTSGSAADQEVTADCCVTTAKPVDHFESMQGNLVVKQVSI